MPYYSNIPTANQKLKDSQPLLLANFTALNAFGNGYADFPVQGSAPTLGGSGATADTGLYTLNNATTSCSEMYIQKISNNVPVQIPFTASKMSNTAASSCTNGWSYLPSGLLVKWGYVTAPNGSLNTVNTLSVSGGPSYTQVFQVYLTPYWSGATSNSASIPILTAAHPTMDTFVYFVTNYSAGSSGFSYLVMGV